MGSVDMLLFSPLQSKSRVGGVCGCGLIFEVGVRIGSSDSGERGGGPSFGTRYHVSISSK